MQGVPSRRVLAQQIFSDRAQPDLRGKAKKAPWPAAFDLKK
jgi:hypothetical protein